MTIEIEQEVELKTEPPVTALIKKVIEAACEDVSCPWEVQVSVLITDDESMRVMNRENRDIDSTTDVLSFPMLDFNAPEDFSFIDEENWEYFDPETGELLIGDIVISADKARAQAEEYGHSLEREVAFLTAHSMYHLFGYDHIDDSDRILMEDKQRTLLDKLGINR